MDPAQAIIQTIQEQIKRWEKHLAVVEREYACTQARLDECKEMLALIQKGGDPISAVPETSSDNSHSRQ